MNKTSRLLLFTFLVGLLLFLGLAFSSWTIPNLIRPAGIVVWLFLRLFVLSLPQGFFWYVLIVAGIVWWLYRLFHGEEPAQPETPASAGDALNSYRAWRGNLLGAQGEGYERSRLRRDLIVLLTSLYVSRQQDANPVEIREALESRQLVLPDPIYRFLFPAKLGMPEHFSLKFTLQEFAQRARNWYRTLTGQEQAEYQQTLDALISFMEHELESQDEN